MYLLKKKEDKMISSKCVKLFHLLSLDFCLRYLYFVDKSNY